MNLDFESLSGVVEFFGDAGAATGKIAKSWETVQKLLKKSEVGTDPDVKLALSELTMQIANAQVANSNLKVQLVALQDELAVARDFQSDLGRYDLWETPAGAIVYRLREAEANNQPLHYLCPSCIENKRKSILQGHAEWRECSTCKAEYRFAPSDGVILVPTNRGRFDDF